MAYNGTKKSQIFRKVIEDMKYPAYFYSGENRYSIISPELKS
jgi:hypothetical protein